jgi:pimeloyl-ACP methyl ester carboxylesterase
LGIILFPELLNKSNIKNKQNISGLVSVSYGGLSGYEQIEILKKSSLNIQLSQNILQSFDAYKKDIDLYPNSIGEIFGMTYRWFNSVFNYKPFDDYKNIDIPILFIHGELDGNVPVESTRYIQDNLPNKPFEYLYFSDADHHSFRNSGKTIKELISKSRKWLNSR